LVLRKLQTGGHRVLIFTQVRPTLLYVVYRGDVCVQYVWLLDVLLRKVNTGGHHVLIVAQVQLCWSFGHRQVDASFLADC
jgi:hypothetical protein